MPRKSTPGIDLGYGWNPGESGIAAELDDNWLRLGILVNLSAKSRTTALPASPAEGDIYIVPADAASNANQVAAWVEGVWRYLVPKRNWVARVEDESDALYRYDGTVWVAGLGTAAYRDIGSDAGNIQPVGEAFSLGLDSSLDNMPLGARAFTYGYFGSIPNCPQVPGLGPSDPVWWNVDAYGGGERITQILTAPYAHVRRAKIRFRHDDVWSDSFDIYTSNMILGACAMSGGLPTGGIMERGSNSNGEYVRYADGTQIVWGSITQNCPDASPIGYFFNTPAAFVGSAVSAYLVTSDWALDVAHGGQGFLGNGSGIVFVVNNHGSALDVKVMFISIGRWV